MQPQTSVILTRSAEHMICWVKVTVSRGGAHFPHWPPSIFPCFELSGYNIIIMKLQTPIECSISSQNKMKKFNFLGGGGV